MFNVKISEMRSMSWPTEINQVGVHGDSDAKLVNSSTEKFGIVLDDLLL